MPEALDLDLALPQLAARGFHLLARRGLFFFQAAKRIVVAQFGLAVELGAVQAALDFDQIGFPAATLDVVQFGFGLLDARLRRRKRRLQAGRVQLAPEACLSRRAALPSLED